MSSKGIISIRKAGDRPVYFGIYHSALNYMGVLTSIATEWNETGSEGSASDFADFMERSLARDYKKDKYDAYYEIERADRNPQLDGMWCECEYRIWINSEGHCVKVVLTDEDNNVLKSKEIGSIMSESVNRPVSK